MRHCLFLILFFIFFSSSNQAQMTCNPPISGVRFDGDYDPNISLRLIELRNADQAVRQPQLEIDWDTVMQEDQARREEVLGYLQAGIITNVNDLFSAALIFQHGDCPEHYALAADLALRSFEAGNHNAGWLYTAAFDRHLQSIGQLQTYGTQYSLALDGNFHLCPIDSATTDAERADYGLPNLEALRERASSFDNSSFPKSRFAFLLRIPILGEILNQVVLAQNCRY